MINVSDAFRARMAESRDFHCAAEMKLANGNVLLRLGDAELTVGGNSYTDAAGTSTLPLGEAVSRSIQIELLNDKEQYADMDFFGATVNLSLAFAVSGSAVERIQLGTFTVTEPESYGETVTITARDHMWRADVPYTTKLTFPATLAQMYRDICETCGISFSTSSFPNSTYVVDVLPEGDYTCRQMLGYIAMMAGGNARINRSGRCEILTYNFADSAPAHDLKEWINLTADTNDITITGVQTTVKEQSTDGGETERVVISGGAGYILSLKNPLFVGHEQTAVDLIGERVIGATLRKFEGDVPAYPLAEFMDAVKITDRRGRIYRTVLTDVNFAFFGATTLSCSVESAVRHGSTYESPASEAITEARRLVAAERTARQTAIKDLADTLSASSGMYITAEDQPDGSSIYYMHNKPTLGESDIVWKLTAEAFGISTDGGETYPYGFTVTGEMVTSLLYAEGIDGNYIKAETVTADKLAANAVTADKIAAKAVSADKLSVETLSAIAANLGTVSAGTIQSSNYKAGVVGMKLTLSDGAIDSPNFKLSVDGKITATSGKIAGWSITESFIGSSQEGGSIYITPASDVSDCWIRAYNAAGGAGTRMFSISKTGILYAHGADIAGKITATSGHIGGNGGWTIKSGAIYSGTSSMTSTAPGAYIGIDGIRVYSSGSKYVNIKDGTLSCVGLDAQGYIIGGSWGAGKCTTMLNDLGVCIVSESNKDTNSGWWRGWVIRMDSSHALVAVPARYSYSLSTGTGTWYLQSTRAVRLGSWAADASGGGTPGTPGGPPRYPVALS